MLDIVDSSLKDSASSFHADEVLRCVQIGLLCVQEHATDRPNMPTVVLMLNSETALPSPKQPAFILGRNSTAMTPSPGGGTICSINDVTVTNVEGR